VSDIATTSTAANTPTPAAPSPPPAPAAPAAPQSQTPGVISDAAYDALPTEVDRDRYSRVRKGPDGGSEWRERSTLQSSTDPAAKPAAGDTAPALVPDQKYQFGDLELKGQEILDLLKFKGETDLRRAAVPADPSQYKTELPKDFVLPAGTDWRFNDADPALAAARAWSHANGLTQDQFSNLIGQYVSMEATKEATYRNAMKRELEALGANATMRVTALAGAVTISSVFAFRVHRGAELAHVAQRHRLDRLIEAGPYATAIATEPTATRRF
jgi:hypothetical protein